MLRPHELKLREIDSLRTKWRMMFAVRKLNLVIHAAGIGIIGWHFPVAWLLYLPIMVEIACRRRQDFLSARGRRAVESKHRRAWNG